MVKPHGLTGEVVVSLWSDLPGRLVDGACFVTDRGPLTVRSVRPHQGRYLVRFEGLVDRAAAESVRGTVLRAAPVDEPGTLWVHELVGAEVVSVDGGHLGTVVAVEANPASDLLVLDGGGLVPLRFVEEHVPGSRVIVRIPDGLLD